LIFSKLFSKFFGNIFCQKGKTRLYLHPLRGIFFSYQSKSSLMGFGFGPGGAEVGFPVKKPGKKFGRKRLEVVYLRPL